jgi:pyruvate ferredoxin oxidoreductase delta subunit
MSRDAATATVTDGSSGKTGLWRLKRPEQDRAKCTRCLMCWLYCPEAAIGRDEHDNVFVRYDYCKGCGICETVCPVKAIKMVKEGP